MRVTCVPRLTGAQPSAGRHTDALPFDPLVSGDGEGKKINEQEHVSMLHAF